MRIDIGAIVDSLDDDKEQFITKCQNDIKRVLWKFKKGQTYHGHKLESILSQPISEKISDNYQAFLNEHKPEIEAQLKQQVADAIDITATLEKILYDELRKKGVKHIQHEAADAFISGCQTAFHSSLAQTTTTSVSHTATTIVGTTVGVSIAHALSIAIAHAVGTALVHVAHSVAFKAMFKAIIVHSAGAIVTATIIHMLASHVSAASAGSALGPFAWAAGGTYILYKILTITKTLGEELAKSLGAHLRGEFRPWTETALESCFQNMTDPKKLLESVVKAEINSALPDIISDVTDSPECPPGYEDVNKEVKRLVGYGEKGVEKVTKRGIFSWFF